MEQAEKGKIVSVYIEDEMKKSYIDYAMSVIVGRALPDVRDGLKPVHRRILFGMKERGWTHERPYVKSAKIVGEVIGNYHQLAVFLSRVVQMSRIVTLHDFTISVVSKDKQKTAIGDLLEMEITAKIYRYRTPS